MGLVEAGGRVGGCLLITVVTAEEPEPKLVEETDPSFRLESSSGSGRNPIGRMDGQNRGWGGEDRPYIIIST